MASASPPKPWERQGNRPSAASIASSIPGASAAPGNATSQQTAAHSSTSSSALATGDSSSAPTIPQKPSSLSNVVNRTASNYSTGNAAYNRPYGSSPYGYGSTYSSPYSRLGGMGGMGGMGGYGGYGGYGSMYGGGGYGSMYGGGMYGGGMYGGMGGMGGMGPMGPVDPNDPNSMTQNFAQSTQATFQIIESIVGAFGGFAQMLESTYMATHSSFFAMVSVAEQFGNLRQTLGSVLGIYTLIRWLRTLVAKLTGRPPPADATALTPANFFAFTGDAPPPGALGADGRPIPPRPSKKPFIMFILAVFGLPYLMGKLIRTLAKSQEEAMQNQPGGQWDEQAQRPQLDPSKLDFCRVLYDFPPPDAVANGTFDAGVDLSVKKGDLVAVLDKSDPAVGPQDQGKAVGQWWRCRARDGRMGYLPAVYLETIERRPQQQITDAVNAGRAQTLGSVIGGGRAHTMTTTSGPGTRANTITGVKGAEKELVGAPKGKPQVEGLEKFQKAWINES